MKEISLLRTRFGFGKGEREKELYLLNFRGELNYSGQMIKSMQNAPHLIGKYDAKVL
jgi:hypothetical protein